MSRRIFSQEERHDLENNPRIEKVLNSNIEFTQDFKDFALLEHYMNGKTCRQIFSEAGLPDWLNCNDYAKDNIKRWRQQAEQGYKSPKGRGRKKKQKPISEMSYEELQARVVYLEEENAFLKKLEALEQQAKKKGLL